MFSDVNSGYRKKIVAWYELKTMSNVYDESFWENNERVLVKCASTLAKYIFFYFERKFIAEGSS